jgi:hypothetical protein
MGLNFEAPQSPLSSPNFLHFVYIFTLPISFTLSYVIMLLFTVFFIHLKEGAG